jgi:NAD(P)-dependent dehydrogenase (short-subunit alcohol dehydrogenase family)
LRLWDRRGTEMAELEGKTIVVTGGASGIGAKAAAKLAGLGAGLVLVGRNRSRGEAMLRGLRALRPGGTEPRIVYGDLSLQREVRRVAADIAKVAPRIDVLVNNAGAIFNSYEETEEGLERTFALNHMGYFLLTGLLLPQLRAAAPARIVVVASEAHRSATLDFADLQNRRQFRGWRAYRRSKLCNILFTRELARRLSGSGITANALHPGFVASGFGDNNGLLFRAGLGLAKRFMAITPDEAADTILELAAGDAGAAGSGEYYVSRRPAVPSAAARDDAAARRLWEESARLAGFDPG